MWRAYTRIAERSKRHATDVQVGDTIRIAREYSQDSGCSTDFVITGAVPIEQFVSYNGKAEKVVKTFNTSYEYSPNAPGAGTACHIVKDQFVLTQNGDVVLVNETDTSTQK